MAMTPCSHVGGEVVEPDRELVGDRAAELPTDVLIEEQRADAEHDHRPDRGEHRQPEPQREAASQEHGAAR